MGKTLLIVYVVIGGISFVLGDIEAQLAAVGVSAAYIAVVQGVTESVIKYVGLLGAAGIVALPALPAVRDRVVQALAAPVVTSSNAAAASPNVSSSSAAPIVKDEPWV